MTNLDILVKQWSDWSTTADKSENGWESDFPRWRELINSAQAAMVSFPTGNVSLSSLAEAWRISEETEELATFSAANASDTSDALLELATSPHPSVRYQVYSVLPRLREKGELVLRRALGDPDSYCRRRALLALATLAPPDAENLAVTAARNDDPYIRLAAIEIAAKSQRPSVRAHIKQLLFSDPVDFVRTKAKNL